MLLHPKGSKKKLLILIAGIIVVLGILTALVLWFKSNAETGATNSIQKSRTDVGTALKALNTKLADTKLSSKDRLNAFNDLDKNLAKISSDTCSIEGKNIMFALSSAKARCDDIHKKLLTVRTSSQKIQESVKDDQALAVVLDPIKTADATNPAKQLEAWNTIAANSAKANISQDGTNLKNQLLVVSSSYKTAWQELIDADKAQNKTNYEAAVKKLDAAKEELAKIATTQTNSFKDNLAQFKQAVSSFK
jgi:hypothetical protein